MWIFDHGPIGWGNLGAHGHADALAVWLHIGGQPVIIDAGTYLFHGDAEARAAFRSTRSHNTVLINESDSSVMTGPFMWSTRDRAVAHLEAARSSRTSWEISASHNGYVRRYGVKHRRTVSMTSPGEYKLSDSVIVLDGGRLQSARASLLINGECDAKTVPGGVEIALKDEMVLLLEFGKGIVRPALQLRGDGLEGQASPSFGVLEPAWRLTWELTSGTSELWARVGQKGSEE
jgi:hypothetical protein